jgi:hypothetical protein
MTGDALVAAARGARESRARSLRRRRATGGALGAVAAVLLVAVAAVALQDHSSTQVVKAGAQKDLGAMSTIVADAVTVTPSTGLVDGQTVTVTARGFDAGTPVTFLECTPSPGGSPVAGSLEPSVSTDVHTPDHAPMPADPAPDPGSAPTTSPEVSPGWECLGYTSDQPVPGTTHVASATALAAPGTPIPAPPEDAVGSVTTASTTMKVVSHTDEFGVHVDPSGVGAISSDQPARPSRSCVNPTPLPLPPRSAPSRGPTDTSPRPSTAGADGPISNETSGGRVSAGHASPSGTSSGDAPADGTASSIDPSTGTSSSDASPPPTSNLEGTCVIIAIGKVGGAETVRSSAPLLFGDTPSPSTSVPSTSVPTTDPTSCTDQTPGTACAPAVDPPASAPVMAGCPADPPAPSPMTGDHTSPLLDFTPTSITICHIPVQELGPPPVLVTDPATIDKITTALAALRDVPDANTACTMEMSDTMVLIAQAGSKRTTIVAELYGCGVVSNGTTIRLGAKSLGWVNALSAAG